MDIEIEVNLERSVQDMYSLLTTEDSPLILSSVNKTTPYGPSYLLLHKGSNLDGLFYLGVPDPEIAADARHVEAARIYSFTPLSQLAYTMDYSKEKMADMAAVLEYVSRAGVPFYVEICVDGDHERFFGIGDIERLLQNPSAEGIFEAVKGE